MVKPSIEVSADPSTVPNWFAEWARLEQQAELEIAFPSAELPPWIAVLLAAGSAGRRVDGLATQSALARARLTAVVPTAAAQELADRLGSGMQGQSPDTPRVLIAGAINVAFELGRNIVDHSAAHQTGFGVARADARRRRLQVAFADRGVGFLASLHRNLEFVACIGDDSEALKLSVQPGVSGGSNPRKNMGMGLPLVIEFCDSLDGELWIASGTALLHRRTIAGQRTNSIRSIPPWRGAWICLDAPLR